MSMIARANYVHSIGGAIWNGLLPGKLANYLPVDEKSASRKIFGSIVVAKKYKAGTAARDAINLAYRETQQRLSIASLALSLPLLLFVIFMRNIKLEEEDKLREDITEKKTIVDS